MKRLVSLLLLVAAGPCVGVGVAPAARAEWELGPPESLPAVAGGPVTHVRRAATDAATGRSAEVRLAIFDARRAAFRVLDQPADGDRGSLGEFLRGPAGEKVLAAVNGGYFHPDYRPLGLLAVDGRVVHPLERAALLSGLLLDPGTGTPVLLRRDAYKPGAATPPPRQALQAGPFLVDNGVPVAGLNAVRPARRTVVLTDGHGRWALAVVPTRLTLAEAAALLARPGLLGESVSVRRALNLDGGSSTALWVRTAGVEPSYEVREWGAVRNFLGVVAK